MERVACDYKKNFHAFDGRRSIAGHKKLHWQAYRLYFPQNVVISIQYYRRFAYTARTYGREAKDMRFCDT